MKVFFEGNGDVEYDDARDCIGHGLCFFRYFANDGVGHYQRYCILHVYDRTGEYDHVYFLATSFSRGGLFVVQVVDRVDIVDVGVDLCALNEGQEELPLRAI